MSVALGYDLVVLDAESPESMRARAMSMALAAGVCHEVVVLAPEAMTVGSLLFCFWVFSFDVVAIGRILCILCFWLIWMFSLVGHYLA